MQLGEPSSVIEVAEAKVAGDRTPVDVGGVVGVVDAVEELQPPLCPPTRLVVAPLGEDGVGKRVERVGPELEVG